MTTRRDTPRPALTKRDGINKAAHGARSFRRWEVKPTIDVKGAEDWDDLIDRVHRALEEIATQVSEHLSVIGRNIDERGMITGGIAHEVIKGRHFHKSLIDEWIAMGSTLSHQQWITL